MISTERKEESNIRVTFENELLASVFRKVSLSRLYTMQEVAALTVAALGVL